MSDNDQMVEPELGDEDMNAWLATMEANAQQLELPQLDLNPMARQQQQGGATDEEPVSEESESEDEESEPPTEEPGPSEQDYITVNGNKIPRADVQRLYEFDQFLRANPAAAQRLAAALPEPTGEPPVSEQPKAEAEAYQEPTKPEWLDEEDPQQKFMWDSMVSLQRSQYEQTQQQKQFLLSQQQKEQQTLERQAAADMTTAITDFREQYPGLNDDDMQTIRNDARPFLDGMMKQLPPVEALRRSMEVAAYANTDMRQKLEMSSPTQTNQQKSTRRKGKLGSIAGTPKSAPKEATRPVFQSDRDMVNAIAHEIADSLGNR